MMFTIFFLRESKKKFYAISSEIKLLVDIPDRVSKQWLFVVQIEVESSVSSFFCVMFSHCVMM